MKKLIVLISVAFVATITGCSGGTGEAKKTLEQYLTALKNKDFQILYDLNSTTQKKVALIHRSSQSDADKEAGLKNNFEEYKTMFDKAEATGTILGIWSEKFLFPADAKYSITDIAVEEDRDSVTAKFRPRHLAKAEVKVTYPNKETAPVLREEKIKEAVYIVVMISGEDVVRGLQKSNITSDWLFRSIDVKGDQITHW